MKRLVLLSGWGIDARIWQTLAPCWPDADRVDTPDWPGYGTRATDPFPTATAMLAERMRDDLPSDAIWVGWSLGGLLAAALLEWLPPPRGLVLIGTGTSFCQVDGITPLELATFRRAFERDPLATWQHFLRWQLQGEPAPKTALKRLFDLIGRTPGATTETLATGLEHLQRLDLTARLVHPPCPLLRMAGARDALMGDSARQRCELILPDSGHCPMLSQPDLLVEHLIDFARRNSHNAPDQSEVKT